VKLLLVSINSRISGKQYSHGWNWGIRHIPTSALWWFWQPILTSFVIIN